MLDKDTGAGFIGISYWAEPVIGTVPEGSAAKIAGLEVGDRVISIDGRPVRHAVEALSILNTAKTEKTKFVIERSGARMELGVVLSWDAQGASNLGLGFKTELHTVRAATTLAAAIGAGFSETASTFSMTLKGLGSLFQGVNVLKALSGPARITYMVGQSMQTGIQNSASGGLAVPLGFIGFLSIGLFIMNLLPIPALDGGQILMFIVEGLRKRMLRPISIYRYQIVGATFILAILVIATMGDIRSFFFPGK